MMQSTSAMAKQAPASTTTVLAMLLALGGCETANEWLGMAEEKVVETQRTIDRAQALEDDMDRTADDARRLGDDAPRVAGEPSGLEAEFDPPGTWTTMSVRRPTSLDREFVHASQDRIVVRVQRVGRSGFDRGFAISRRDFEAAHADIGVDAIDRLFGHAPEDWTWLRREFTRRNLVQPDEHSDITRIAVMSALMAESGARENVRFESTGGDGARVRYVSIGFADRDQAERTSGFTDTAEALMTWGNYYIWTERNGVATSDDRQIFRIDSDLQNPIVLEETK